MIEKICVNFNNYKKELLEMHTFVMMLCNCRREMTMTFAKNRK